MPSKKRGTGQGPSIRKFRSDVAKLKEKGLVSKRVDARSQKPTRYMREQVKKFTEVLEGRAAVVHTDTRQRAAKFRNAFTVKGKSIVVPKERGETVRLDKRSNTIVGYVENLYGHRVRRERLTKNIESAADLPRGDGYTYTLPLAGGRLLITKDDPDDFITFIMPYEQGPGKIYKDIWKHVIIERYADPDDAADAVGDHDAD